MSYRLQNIKLQQFRSYQELDFDFTNQITVITGANGHGKTNLLEAIYTLSLGQSFRTNDYTNLVNWDSDYSRITAKINQAGIDTIESFFSRHPKRKNYKIDGVNQKQSQFIGHLQTVLFHPEDLNMLYLSPLYRRRYLDIILSQTDREYLIALTNYRKVIKHKNALLKQIQKKALEFGPDIKDTDLEIWNFQLVDFASTIIKSRHDFLKRLNTDITGIYQGISDHHEEIAISYKNKATANQPSTDNLNDQLHRLLEEYKSREILSGKSLIGPHRDDIIFTMDHHNINDSASRGEFRTLLLAIKLAEIDYITEKTGRSPLLLLDDVFSELDIHRQNHLLNAVKGSQAIITTTAVNPDHQILNASDSLGVVQIDDLC